MAALRGRLLSGVSPTYASRLPCFARTRPIDSALSKARLPPSTCGEVAEWLKAPHSKFVYCRRAPSRCIPERPDPWAFLECPSVPHPFLSRFVPRRSVAISVAKGRDLFCLKDCARKSVGTRLDPNRGSSRCPRPGKNFEQFAAHDQAREPWRFICSGRMRGPVSRHVSRIRAARALVTLIPARIAPMPDKLSIDTGKGQPRNPN
jgi:hypothetical protein